MNVSKILFYFSNKKLYNILVFFILIYNKFVLNYLVFLGDKACSLYLNIFYQFSFVLKLVTNQTEQSQMLRKYNQNNKCFLHFYC